MLGALHPLSVLIYTHYKTYISIISFTFAGKPPDDPWLRKKFFINKQKFTRYHRLYANSLTGGVDRAKTIIVTKTGSKTKKGKNKEQKMVSAWYIAMSFLFPRSFSYF